MRRSILLLLMITASLLSFGWYCETLIGLVMGLKTGVDELNHLAAIVKSVALLAYTYFALQFIKNKINFL
ncbi:hypothetical protein [Spirosoma flavum]|uniref:Uncharacterized protein n=1 Tax=Spirosoma flavum TaxID=2048557 RepID=A0ABW6AMS0_9BACT